MEDILDDQEDMANMFLGRKARLKARATQVADDSAAPSEDVRHDEEVMVSAAQRLRSSASQACSSLLHASKHASPLCVNNRKVRCP